MPLRSWQPHPKRLKRNKKMKHTKSAVLKLMHYGELGWIDGAGEHDDL